jgi:2-polyprenyl-3-methyl-5-hydroxy-6-metoxy-1,4-benzoquinol methylase
MRGFITNKEAFLLEKVHSLRPMKVLHVGCTTAPNHVKRWENGTLLHAKLISQIEAYGGVCVGIDIDSESLAFVKSKMPNADLRLIDAHKLAQFFGPEFDLIIAGDVIEHLANPGIFLQACAGVIAKAGVLIITTTNAFGVIRNLKSMLFHEAVHAEHTAYYSHKTLRRLLQLEKMRILSAGYYRSEPLSYGYSFNRALSNSIERFACLIWPQYAEGVIICAAKDPE